MSNYGRKSDIATAFGKPAASRVIAGATASELSQAVPTAAARTLRQIIRTEGFHAFAEKERINSPAIRDSASK